MKYPKMYKWLILLLAVVLLVGFVPVMQGVQRFKTILAENVQVSNDTTLNNMTVNGQITLSGGQVLTQAFENLVVAAPTSLATATPAVIVDLENGLSNAQEWRKVGTPQVIVDNSMKLSANAGVVASAPTAAATSLPGLVANSNSAGGVIQEWRKLNTPVAYVSNAGVIVANTGAQVAPNIIVAASTAVGTATPVVLAQGGASNLIEARNPGATPVFQVGPAGAVTGLVLQYGTAGQRIYCNVTSAFTTSLAITSSTTSIATPVAATCTLAADATGDASKCTYTNATGTITFKVWGAQATPVANATAVAVSYCVLGTP